MLRVLMLSKAVVVGIYQRKLEEMAQHDIDLLALVPPAWKDERGETPLERAFTEGYTLKTTPIRLNGNFHLHHYPQLGTEMTRFKPDVVHVDEEPYNVATWHALYHARRVGAKTVCFSWQNINRLYPLPFRVGEAWALRRTDALIAGTDSAAQVWREKGYDGTMSVIPQFGIDPDLFQPADQQSDRPFTVGYIGRLVEEKGVHLLLDAMAQLLDDHWRLRLVGDGPYRFMLTTRAKRLGVSDRVDFVGLVPSVEMPRQYHAVDVLALPSLTRPNWKEQFGRVLVEAMASGVPVVGSDSGAIPGVIGDAGLVALEGDVPALVAHLAALQADPALRTRFGEAGRRRALAHFTHAQVAEATISLYHRL